MTDSIRQQIIDAIDTRFKAILTAGGYKTNLGNHVFAWRDTPLEATDLPGLIYKDTTEQREPGAGIYDLILSIEIELFSTSAAGIRNCLADLEKAIFTDESWGELALNSEIETDEMAIEQKENTFCASKIILAVEYRTVRGDPYIQA